MVKKFTVVILLLSMLCCTVVFSTTYAKYLLSKNVTGEIEVPETDYCIQNGFNKLKDCMLVMENYSKSTEAAKLYISSKTANLGNIAPSIKFVEKSEIVENLNGLVSSSSHYTLSKTYTFNSSTGIFTLGNDYVNDNLSDSYINYYTCGNTETTFINCSKLYQIKSWKLVTDNYTTYYKITKAIVLDYVMMDSFDSNVGLYGAQDNFGTSYYYRGNVKNNYVSFAGFMWRIVRQNGDESIRLVYAGKDVSSAGEETGIGVSSYNSKNIDPTYVGYMYGENFVRIDGDTATFFVNFKENTKYVFGNSFAFDETTKKFKITGDYITGTWKDNYSSIINNYPYTCLRLTSSYTCDYVLNVVRYVSASTMSVKYISYSSSSYDAILKNDVSSNIKLFLDTWYEKNLQNDYANYLSDNIYCNERMFISGTGYLLSPNTLFKAARFFSGVSYSNREPTFVCSQTADEFGVKSGNQNLAYPIGLLTADEIIYAGAVNGVVNNNFYLYNGVKTWTMTPYGYGALVGYARVIYLETDGQISAGGTSVERIVRPVVNLRSDIKITSGNGTAESPYIVSL